MLTGNNGVHAALRVAAAYLSLYLQHCIGIGGHFMEQEWEA